LPLVLFKYIARKNLLYLLSVLGVVAAMIFVFDFIELMRASYNTSLSTAVIFKMALMKNYSHIQRTFSFVFIISTILTYANLTKTNELIAARSYGMSVWQFLLPSIAVAFTFGFINILILNPIGSSLLSRFERIEAIHLKGQPSTIIISSNGLWFRESSKAENIIIHALRVSQETKELFDVVYFIQDKEHKFSHRIDATKAELKDNHYWTLTEATITRADYSSEYKETFNMPTNINFAQIQESVISPDTVSIYKLPGFIKATQDSGFSVLRHLHYLYKMLISPFFYVAMVLVGLNFATTSPRSKYSSFAMLIGIIFGFLVYFISDIINAVGMAGNIPLLLSATSPTLICLSIGLYFTLHYEDG
jgi:lipopolysaccharide export system permease protein